MSDERWTQAAADELHGRLELDRWLALLEQRAVLLGVAQATACGARPPDLVEAEQLVAAARSGAVDGIWALVIRGMPPAPPPSGGGR